VDRLSRHGDRYERRKAFDTIEKILEFLAGAIDADFTIPADESVLHDFVATVVKRFRYFKRPKEQRGILRGP